MAGIPIPVKVGAVVLVVLVYYKINIQPAMFFFYIVFWPYNGPILALQIFVADFHHVPSKFGVHFHL